MSVRLVPLVCLLAVVACTDDAPTITGTADDSSGTTTDASTTAVPDETSEPPDPSVGTSVATGTTGDPDTTTDAGSTTDTTDGDTGSGEPVYPDPDWDQEPPEDHGLDPIALAEFAEFVGDNNSDCLVVVHAGVIVGQWYWNGFTPDTDAANVYSVTKSITSALVGIAQERGELSLDDSAAAHVQEWIGGPSEVVTLRNLVSNDSGRHWDFLSDYVTMGLQPDQTAYAIGLDQQAEPGAYWEYNNAAIQTLERVLETATAQDVGDYATARLFEPIGMTASYGRDGSGNPLTYQGVSASCRDLARFGYLFLRDGRWAGGVQVVPEAWVAESTTPSTPLNAAYGYMWWLNQDGHYVLPSAPARQEGDGQLVPGAPDHLYSAVGAFGQLVIVDRVGEYVVVRLGAQPASGDLLGTDFLRELWLAFSAALVE
jgi:CubicO group peptidase (beta-lactamase class C family)